MCNIAPTPNPVTRAELVEFVRSITDMDDIFIQPDATRIVEASTNAYHQILKRSKQLYKRLQAHNEINPKSNLPREA